MRNIHNMIQVNKFELFFFFCAKRKKKSFCMKVDSKLFGVKFGLMILFDYSSRKVEKEFWRETKRRLRLGLGGVGEKIDDGRWGKTKFFFSLSIQGGKKNISKLGMEKGTEKKKRKKKIKILH